VEVSAEIQRLSATGFVKKVTTLTARRRELPVLLRAHLSSTWFEPWWKDATVIEQTVELLGLPAVPTAPSPDATSQQEGTMPCGDGPAPTRPGFAASSTGSASRRAPKWGVTAPGNGGWDDKRRATRHGR
jgi:hypothetical protein